MKKKKRREALAPRVPILIALTLILALPAQSLAWGSEGHQIVARIAGGLLTQPARGQVKSLLSASGENIQSVALWADGIRGSEPGKRPETPHWHFVDTPLGENYSASRDCVETPNGSCVVSALEMFQEVLSKRRKGYFDERFNRYEALKFIIHFTGDIHQPLHCITDTRDDPDGDQGGNKKLVIWFGTSGKKLHGIWDTNILQKNMSEQNNASINTYADFLFNGLTQQEKDLAKPPVSNSPTVVSRQNIERWAIEGHEIAEDAYSDIGTPTQNGNYRLGQNYYNAHREQVDKQLKLAGIRLARILNENLR